MSRFLNSSYQGFSAYVPGEQPKNMNGLIKLNTNESPYPPSPMVYKALSKQAVDSLRLYSDPDCTDFLAALSETFGVDKDNCIATNGSDEALSFCFNAYGERGIAFADITYGFYSVYAGFYSTKAEVIPLKEDFSIDINDYMDYPATVLIANPNAPTGLCLAVSEIEKLVKKDKNRLVIIDEAYVDFGAQSAAPLIKKYDNLLIVGTLSKSRCLAGARAGYMLGSRELISDMNLIKYSTNPFNVNRLSALCAGAALRDRKYFDKCVGAVIAQRRVMTQEMEKLGFTLTKSFGNFIFAGKHKDISAVEYQSALRENNILVRHFDLPRINDYLRITIGTPEQTERFIEVTKEILSKVKAK